MTTCRFCQGPTPANLRRDKPRGFCRDRCRVSYHTGARKLALQMRQAGLVTDEHIRAAFAASEACTDHLPHFPALLSPQLGAVEQAGAGFDQPALADDIRKS